MNTDKEKQMKAMTIILDDILLQRVDGIAKSLSRPRSWIIKQALERFVSYEEWYIQEVKDGLEEVDRGDIATEKDVVSSFKKWGVNAG
jgi:predicted transcriptional regulator